MFVRWIPRRRTRVSYFGRAARQGDTLLTAVLVEAVRVDGKPRQRHIAVLGSIYDSHLKAVGSRADFWTRVDARLAQLDVPHRAIKAAIAKRVPCPTKREIAAAERISKQARQQFVSRINAALPIRRKRKRKARP
jgi:hypothetical protein